MSLLHSLVIKVVMLGVTLGVVWWIAWEMPQNMSRPVAPAPSAAFTMSEPPAREVDVVASAAPVAPPVVAPVSEAALLDVNEAQTAEFERLPGVGPVLAARLVAYRTAHGPFHTVDELRSVKGIGQKTLAKLKPLVKVVLPVSADKKAKAAI